MCVMEVHAGQRTSTMCQAMAHNVRTVVSDLEFLEEVLIHRGEADCWHGIERSRDYLERAYAILLTQFGMEVAGSVSDSEGHVHTHDHGNERSFTEVAHHDAGLARKDETR